MRRNPGIYVAVFIMVLLLSPQIDATLVSSGTTDTGMASEDIKSIEETDQSDTQHLALIFKDERSAPFEWITAINGSRLPVSSDKWKISISALSSKDDVSIVWDYGDFVSASVTDEGLGNLRREGRKVRLLDEVFMIGRGGHYFDYRKEKPSIDEQWMLNVEGENPALYIMTFKGPIVQSWLNDVSNMGGEIFTRISRYSYLVLLPKEVAPHMLTLPYIGWLEPYHYLFRVAPSLESILLNPSAAPDSLDVMIIGLVSPRIASSAFGMLADEVDRIGNLKTSSSSIRLRGHIRASDLPKLIRRADVEWVEPWYATPSVGQILTRFTLHSRSPPRDTRSASSTSTSASA